MLGGWEFSGISVFQSGRPLLITAPDQTNLYNFSSTNGRANRGHSAVLQSGQSNSHWFDTTAFSVAPAFTIPNDSLSQPNVRGPRRINFDWSLIKNTKFKDRYNLQFRAEFYNIFNHPALNATGATTDVTNAQFGQIISSAAEANATFSSLYAFYSDNHAKTRLYQSCIPDRGRRAVCPRRTGTA